MPYRTPDVTVVIPSKDRPRFVERAVQSACAQSNVELEVVVVDDGSIPPLDLAFRDSRVRVVRHETSRGVASARNRGVAEANGAWIAFLDDDDLWAPSKLEQQLSAVADANARWCYSGALCLSGDLEVRFAMPSESSWATPQRLMGTNVVGSPSGVLVATSLIRECGGFDASFSIFADWDLWLRMADREPAVPVDEPLLGYVTHDGSMHRESLRAYVAEFRRFARRHRERGRIGHPALWEWLADTTRDQGRPYAAAALGFGTAVRWLEPDVAVRTARALASTGRASGTIAPVAPPWVTRWRDATA